ncbi:MAG: DUF2279 domain-containing protein [Salibacteraceae bacterium]
MKKFSILMLLFCSNFSIGQSWHQPADSLNENRAILIGATQSITYVGSLSGLQLLWYSDYDDQPFQFFNDWEGWLQMDKIGHTVSTYQVGLNLYKLNRWAGLSERNSIWLSAGVSYSFITLVEVMDGYSAGWGFSAWDAAFNTLGTGAFLAQQLTWKEQRIKLKYSFYPSGLDQNNTTGITVEEANRAENLFGTGLHEQWLKDYNGQTYWISANVWSLIGKPDRFPKWLNLAVGYSANNMLGAESNAWELYPNVVENSEIYTSTLQRERQLLLSIDVDLDHVNLPIYLKWMRPLFGVIKFPFPALEWNSERGLVGHGIYF